MDHAKIVSQRLKPNRVIRVNNTYIEHIERVLEGARPARLVIPKKPPSRHTKKQSTSASKKDSMISVDGAVSTTGGSGDDDGDGDSDSDSDRGSHFNSLSLPSPVLPPSELQICARYAIALAKVKANLTNSRRRDWMSYSLTLACLGISILFAFNGYPDLARLAVCGTLIHVVAPFIRK